MSRATLADLTALRATMVALYGPRDPARCDRLEEELDEWIARRSACPAITFKAGAKPGEWIIEGGRVVRSTSHALTAAHRAIVAHGTSAEVHAGDFTASGSKRPGNSIRNGLARAIAWAEREGCHDLASALLCIHVSGDDVVRFVPTRDLPKIITQ